MAGPIEQFEIRPIVSFGEIGGHDIAFSNSSPIGLTTPGTADAVIQAYIFTMLTACS